MIHEMPETCPQPQQAKSSNCLSGDPLLLTVEEVMAMLRLGRTSVFALLAAGDMPNPAQHLKRRRIGRATRVTMASVLQLAGHREDPNAPADQGRV